MKAYYDIGFTGPIRPDHVPTMAGDSNDHAGYSNIGALYAFGYMRGFHVLIGACLIFWMMLRTAKGDFSSEYYTPVEGVGLFWHIVDLIWIYLFPLLYLVG